MCRYDLTQKTVELIKTRAGNDDGIPATMGFLGNFEKPATIIFAKLYKEVFSFHLKLASAENIFHGSCYKR